MTKSTRQASVKETRVVYAGGDIWFLNDDRAACITDKRLKDIKRRPIDTARLLRLLKAKGFTFDRTSLLNQLKLALVEVSEAQAKSAWGAVASKRGG